MGLFRRRRDESPSTARGVPSPPADPDEALPMLDRQDATQLAALAREAFAEVGLETTLDEPGVLRGADGHRFGLWNLAATVATLPRRDWPAQARQHARLMVEAHSTAEVTDLDSVRDRILLKLAAREELPFSPPAYAVDVAPGLVGLVAVDHPTHVQTIGKDSALDPLGGWDAVRDVALGNLRRLRSQERHEVLGDDAEPTSRVHVFVGDFFGASRLIVLDDVLRDELGVERPAHGALVAVPHRHVLVVHVVQGPGVVSALRLMAGFAAGEHAGAAGSLSPHVFHARHGRIEQVTETGPGGPSVHVRGSLQDAFRALGLLSDD